MKFGLAGIDNLLGLIDELITGLNKLSLIDNFESFEVNNKQIKAGQVAKFPNALTVKPSKYIITSQTGDATIAKTDDNPWTSKELYLKNYGTNDVTISVIFMK